MPVYFLSYSCEEELAHFSAVSKHVVYPTIISSGSTKSHHDGADF